MPYNTNGVELKKLISNELKSQIFAAICEAVSNFCDTLVTVGYSLGNKEQNNKEAAQKLCAVAEVVYDGFKGEDQIMAEYQNNTLKYSDRSLMITIFSNLIRGINVLEDEENPYHLNHTEILGNISDTYKEDADLCNYLKYGC